MSELYKAYEEYSKTLRTWFVAYGVGAPLLLVTNERLAARLAAAPELGRLVAAYCIGVGVQVLLGIVNKNTMWGCYYGEVVPDFKLTRRYRFAAWFSGQYWIDALADFLTAALFAAASYRVFGLVFP